MSDDEIYQKRDILMARMDENLQHLVTWSKDHTMADEKYQEKTDKTLDDLKSFKTKQLAVLGAIVLIINFALKIFFK